MKLLPPTLLGLVCLSTQFLFGCCGEARPPATQPAASAPATRPIEPAALSLFDGKTLANWKATDYAGAGEPRAENGSIVLPVGERLTGVNWTGASLPKINYEISFDAQRVDGSDFFVGLTFPSNDSFGSLILGGWGGTVCGISSLDDEDAAHNDTRTFQSFTNGKWYHVRLRVTPTKIEAWLDDAKIIDAVTTGKKLSLRIDIEASKPLGLASFQSTAAIKEIKLKLLAP